MNDAVEDQAALQLLEAQRSRLADRLRPPWWYLVGIAVMYAVVFAFPFASRFLGVSVWPFLVGAAVVAFPLQWAWTRFTGIKMPPRDLSSPGPGRASRYALVVVSVAAIVGEPLLIEHGLTAVAIGIAVLAVATEVALQQELLRGVRQEVRNGGVVV